MRCLFIYIVLLTVIVLPSISSAQVLTATEQEAYKTSYVPCGTFDFNTETKKVKRDSNGKEVIENGQKVYETIITEGVPDGIVDNPCGFGDIIRFGTNAIKGWIFISAIIATLGFAYAGYLYITAMGSEEKIKHAHSIFYKTVLGFAFMLSAWLIVKVFENAFLCKPGDANCDTGTLDRSFLRNQ